MKKRIIFMAIVMIFCTYLIACSKESDEDSDYVIYKEVYSTENKSVAKEEDGFSSETEKMVEESTKTRQEFEDTQEDAEISESNDTYDNKDVEEREKNFLGSYYSEYKNVLAGIRSMSDSVYSEINLDNLTVFDPKEETLKIYGEQEEADFNFAEAAGFKAVTIRGKALTVISKYDNTRLICAYSYPRNASRSLLCIELVDGESSVDGREYDIGDAVDIYAYPSIGKLVHIEGWDILFVKGYDIN